MNSGEQKKRAPAAPTTPSEPVASVVRPRAYISAPMQLSEQQQENC